MPSIALTYAVALPNYRISFSKKLWSWLNISLIVFGTSAGLLTRVTITFRQLVWDLCLVLGSHSNLSLIRKQGLLDRVKHQRIEKAVLQQRQHRHTPISTEDAYASPTTLDDIYGYRQLCLLCVFLICHAWSNRFICLASHLPVVGLYFSKIIFLKKYRGEQRLRASPTVLNKA